MDRSRGSVGRRTTEHFTDSRGHREVALDLKAAVEHQSGRVRLAGGEPEEVGGARTQADDGVTCRTGDDPRAPVAYLDRPGGLLGLAPALAVLVPVLVAPDTELQAAFEA